MRISAQGDESADVVHVDLLDALVPRAQAAVRKAGRLESLAQEAETAERVLLLDDEDRLHVRGR
jgi:hypothetical protein